MHLAESGGSHWRAVDWHSFDDLIKPETSKVETIKQYQEPANAILLEMDPGADDRELAAIILEDNTELAPISEKLHSTEV